MCERLSERLLSGQQQHSAIYLPWRQDSQHTMQACTHPHTHTHTLPHMWKKNKDTLSKLWKSSAFAMLNSTCKEITLMQAHGHVWQQTGIIFCDADARKQTLAGFCCILLRWTSGWHIQSLHAPHVWHQRQTAQHSFTGHLKEVVIFDMLAMAPLPGSHSGWCTVSSSTKRWA